VSERACVVLVTAPSSDVAAALARTLVEERLAACGNILPGVRSIYRWQDEVQDEQEVLLLLKTVRPAVAALTERVVALHPYELPEVIALPVLGGLDGYIGWIEESTSRAQEKQ
jgi:periplasmic divalent cation tolerance protein